MVHSSIGGGLVGVTQRNSVCVVVYYAYDHKSEYKDQVISIHALPLNEGSDPDIYVSK
jgi:hypothetical protein